MTITYTVGNGLYLNITNRCHCSCVFCIRRDHDGVGDGDNLWLEHDPSLDEIIKDLGYRDLDSYDEVVFCGYGEPTERLDILLETCRYLRTHAPELPIRLNTNGLSALLLAGQDIAPKLEGLVDSVSISLNAATPEVYNQVTRPVWGAEAFQHMIDFAKSVKQYVPKVQFSVVDVIAPREIQQCQILADNMKIPLRVRTKS